MALTKTPVCEFGERAPDFYLKGVDGRQYSLQDCKGDRGLLVMFICNHCPYVKAIVPQLIQEVKALTTQGIGCVGINSNDSTNYSEDSFDNMVKFAKAQDFPFPYLWDETQSVARAYKAVCTPDFFGYNANLELQYRGCLMQDARRELFEAMSMVAKTGRGPVEQFSSQGCSIKFFE